MTATKTQMRGNCQCCGRDQAALASGKMSKHGYTVDHGWFSGVCSGQNHKPMQHDRTVTDTIIAQVRADVAKLLKTAEAYKAGTAHPARIDRACHVRGEDKTIAWDEAPEWLRKDGLRSAIYALEGRARAGAGFADDLEALVNQVHGGKLREVKVDAGPAPILRGERRVSQRGVLTVTFLNGARVYWKDEKGFGSWTGSSAWRRLELVA